MNDTPRAMTDGSAAPATGRSWRSVAVLAVALLALLTACNGGSDAGGDGPDGDGADEADVDAPDADEPDTDAPDGDPVTIGFLGELTGPFAIWGIPARNGMQLAVDELNADGGIDGRPVELVVRDTQGTPEEAVTALRGMIERDGVVAVGGIISSDVGLATSRVAEEQEVPLFLVKAGSDAILTQDTRYTFRTCLPAAPMTMGPFAQFIASEGVTRVGAIIADYAWGRAIEEAIEEQIGGPGGLDPQIEVAPVPETDFTSYLRRLEDLDPELIIATGHPPGAAAITRQAADLGFDAFVTGSDSSAVTIFEGVGEAAYDRYVDLSCADYAADDYIQLATRYHDEFADFMEDDAVAGYGQVLMLRDAIEATGGTDPTAIADHLRTTTFELPGYAWDLQWTEWGELAEASPLLVVMREQTPPDGVNPGAPWYLDVILRPDPLEPFVP